MRFSRGACFQRFGRTDFCAPEPPLGGSPPQLPNGGFDVPPIFLFFSGAVLHALVFWLISLFLVFDEFRSSFRPALGLRAKAKTKDLSMASVPRAGGFFFFFVPPLTSRARSFFCLD